jgi:hypothetical protein
VHARKNARYTSGRKHAKGLAAEQLDDLFDSGSDEIDKYIDWSKMRRPGREIQRVNVDFPVDLLRAIDQEAQRIGVTRQAFIKLRLADTLESGRRMATCSRNRLVWSDPDRRQGRRVAVVMQWPRNRGRLLLADPKELDTLVGASVLLSSARSAATGSHWLLDGHRAGAAQ